MISRRLISYDAILFLVGPTIKYYWKWDDTGCRSIDASCLKYHTTTIHHYLLNKIKHFYNQYPKAMI